MTASLQIVEAEWLELLARPRALVVKLLYPLVIGVPLVFLALPSLGSMAVTLLVSTVSGLGTAAVLGRERSAGLNLRFRLAPRPAGRTVLDRVVAASTVDLVQVAPLLVLAVAVHPGGVAWVPALAAALAGTVLTVNALGAFASSLGSSPGEVMVWVMLPLLPSFYLSGLFTAPAGPLAAIARAFPFGYLRAALEGTLGGRPTYDMVACAIAGLAFAVLGAAAAYAAGRRVLEAA
jgi:hypothetical protein